MIALWQSSYKAFCRLSLLVFVLSESLCFRRFAILFDDFFISFFESFSIDFHQLLLFEYLVLFVSFNYVCVKLQVSINQFVKVFQSTCQIIVYSICIEKSFTLFVNKSSTNNLNLTFSNNFVLSSKLLIIVFQLDVFRKVDHRYVTIISNELRFILDVIVFTNFRSVVIRRQIRDNKTFFVESFVYSSKWTTIKSDFRTVAKVFYNQIVEYRQTQIYRNFLHLRLDEINSTFTNSIDDTSKRKSYIISNASRISRRHQNVDDIFIIRQRFRSDETILTFSVSSLTNSKTSINANNNSVDIDFDVIDSTNIRQTFNSQESSTTIEKIVRNDMFDQSTFSNQQRI